MKIRLHKNFSGLLFILFLLSRTLFSQDYKTVVDSINALPHDIVVNNIDSSIEIFSKNAVLASNNNYRFGKAKSLSILAGLFHLRGKYDKSTEAFIEATELFTELASISDLALLYGDQGYRLRRRDLDKANAYLQNALAIAEDNGFKEVLNVLYDHYGVLKEMEEKLDSAKYYYEKSLYLKYELELTLGIPYSLNNIAGIEATNGNYSEAIKLLDLSDEYRNKESGDYGRTENKIIRADLYFHMQKLDSAIYYYKQAIQMKGAMSQNYMFYYCYEQLTKAYTKKRDFENAYLNHIKYTAYKDSIQNIELSSKIADLEIGYETEKKDRLIAENDLEIKERNNQLLIAGSVILTLLIIAFGIYRTQREKNFQLKREMELKTRLKDVEIKEKISGEKLRISRELHDNIGSHLTFMISSLDNLTYQHSDNEFTTKLNSLSGFGKETLQELRSTIWAMNSEEGSLKSLILKLNELKHRFNESVENCELIVEMNIEADINLTSVQNLNIYRIVQEAVQNSLKHSGASSIKISFNESDSGFEFTIQDNGKGFDYPQIKNGNGLLNMRARCEEINGLFLVDNRVGTTITCSITI
ncbi:MAG: hypothetical protein KKA84_10160 [Bacteroidetes bacterium]|nr:hypothetical protein [Bacteroidota bacterium]